MRRGDDGHDDGNHADWTALGPAVLVVIAMLIGCVAAFMLMNLDSLRPKVGDIVVFHQTTREQDVWQLEVATYVPTPEGRQSCVMDPAVIVRDGGSLVIEGRDDSNLSAQYRLHWAGAHSAAGAGDCAGSADIAVSRIDLQKLANAAGGFGVETGVIR